LKDLHQLITDQHMGNIGWRNCFHLKHRT
jgi:hypothetical protein